MLRTNADKVVKLSVQGRVSYPSGARGHRVDAEGNPFLLPSTGGISYNVKVGDPAFGWAGDHVEPGVSTLIDGEKRESAPNLSYHFYSCVGNEVIVVSGDAKRKRGVVTGHHGGAEHVMIDFPSEVLEKLTMDDRFLVRAWGQGLKLLDHPDIFVFNLDPDLLQKMRIKDLGDGRIEVPVVAIVPGHLMGSGVGSIVEGDRIGEGRFVSRRLTAGRLGDELDDLVGIFQSVGVPTHALVGVHPLYECPHDVAAAGSVQCPVAVRQASRKIPRLKSQLRAPHQQPPVGGTPPQGLGDLLNGLRVATVQVRLVGCRLVPAGQLDRRGNHQQWAQHQQHGADDDEPPPFLLT